MTVLLAGVPFVAIAHHDLRMFRTPGVYVFSRRAGSQRSLLHVGHSDAVASAYLGRAWNAALAAGMNEVLVTVTAKERLDRLQIAAMIARAYAPVPTERTQRADAVNFAQGLR